MIIAIAVVMAVLAVVVGVLLAAFDRPPAEAGREQRAATQQDGFGSVPSYSRTSSQAVNAWASRTG
jgi:hypothetical protein